jgi:hypothetical protein
MPAKVANGPRMTLSQTTTLSTGGNLAQSARALDAPFTRHALTRWSHRNCHAPMRITCCALYSGPMQCCNSRSHAACHHAEHHLIQREDHMFPSSDTLRRKQAHRPAAPGGQYILCIVQSSSLHKHTTPAANKLPRTQLTHHMASCLTANSSCTAKPRMQHPLRGQSGDCNHQVASAHNIKHLSQKAAACRCNCIMQHCISHKSGNMRCIHTELL